MDYVILTSVHSKLDLEEQVRSYMEDGWQVQGGVSVSRQTDQDLPADVDIQDKAKTYTLWAQAMVMEGE
ncbi:MAG: hypothetical protein QM737_22760 [Ferruginibacter sp.]